MTVIISPQGPSQSILKSPNEILKITFDFTMWLLSGNTISSAVVTIKNPLNPSDPVAASMVGAPGSVSGTNQFNQLIMNGTNGTTYSMACLATCSDGQKIELSASILINPIYGVVT